MLALALLRVLEGGRSRRPVVYTGFGLKVIMVGSGGFGVRCFLCERSRLVSVCWMLATRLKGVMLGRWRWARRIFGVWWFPFGWWSWDWNWNWDWRVVRIVGVFALYSGEGV